MFYIISGSKFLEFSLTNFSKGEFFIIFSTEKELEGDEGHLNHHLRIQE